MIIKRLLMTYITIKTENNKILLILFCRSNYIRLSIFTFKTKIYFSHQQILYLFLYKFHNKMAHESVSVFL